MPFPLEISKSKEEYVHCVFGVETHSLTSPTELTSEGLAGSEAAERVEVGLNAGRHSTGQALPSKSFTKAARHHVWRRLSQRSA